MSLKLFVASVALLLFVQYILPRIIPNEQIDTVTVFIIAIVGVLAGIAYLIGV